jgi:hypothetical protein
MDDKRNGAFVRTTKDGKKLKATYNNGKIIGNWN